MRRLLSIGLMLLPLGTCTAAINNVRLSGTTATQAVIAYTAPDLAACTVEVSESPAYTPPVPDVDAGLFANADRDDRPGSLASGRDRVFVIGKRTADLASDGRFRSRALQAYTTHYYRISCGADLAAGSFRTQNIALGNTYPEQYPASAEAPGEPAWPAINHGGAAGDKAVDPQTGALVSRLTPGAFLASGYSAGATLNHLGAFDDSGGANGWNTSGATLPASYTADGSEPPKLYVPVDPSGLAAVSVTLSGGGSSLDNVTATITGTATGAGDDSVVLVCPTLDGVNCAAGALVREVSLAACGGGCRIGDDTELGMNTWFAGRTPSFNGHSMVKTTSTATYNNTTGELTWTSGNYFRGWWTAGTRVWIGGTPYKVGPAPGPTRIAIAPGLGFTDAAVVGQAFGFLIWKKTAANGTGVSVAGVSARASVSSNAAFWDGPFMDHCHPTPVLYGTREGYHCGLKSSGAVLAWIDKETGDTNLLGHIAAPARSGENGWGNVAAGYKYGMTFDASDPNVLYGVIWDVNGKQIVVRFTYTGDNSPKTGNRLAYYSAPWTADGVTNLTPYNPSGTHYDLESLIQAFDPRYDPAQFTCGEDHMNSPHLVVRCQANDGQDFAPGGWVVVFDPRITPGPGANPVWAALPTSGAGVTNATPGRWCSLHALQQGAAGWAGFESNHANGALFRTELAAAIDGAGTTIAVSGDPGAGAADIARTGDIFTIDSEWVKILARISATEWLVQRGYGGTEAAAHAAGASVVARCTAIVETGGASPVWWNFAGDPHGWNATGSTVILDAPDFHRSHGAYQNGTTIKIGACENNVLGYRAKTGVTPPQSFGQPASLCMGQRGFAGVSPTLYASNGHPSLKNLLAAPAGEPLWALDSTWVAATAYAQPPALALLPGTSQLYVGTKSYNRKHAATVGFCGDHPLTDVSGPTSSLGDGPDHAWKYCVALRNGECRPEAAAGQVYVNCPARTMAGCNSGQQQANGEFAEDACVLELRSGAGVTGALQIGLERSYSRGELMRRLSSGFARYRRTMSVTASNAKATPAGEWALFATAVVDGFRGYHFGVKVPPFPAEDSVTRSTFVTVQVQVGSRPPGTHNVVAEFGYGPDLYCTTRREVCAANRSVIDEAIPFYWASEPHTGLDCAPGCSIAIPALPERVLYYRLVYRAADNSVIARSRTLAVVTP